MSSLSLPTEMSAVRLHGPRDLRVEPVPTPNFPGVGESLIRVTATGICGSDLHSYKDARIGESMIPQPFIIGHEFGGVIEAVGPDAQDGHANLLQLGMRVAVDPAQPCHRCPMCRQGHPNLCHRLRFCGNYPESGSLCQWISMPAHSCFPVPDCFSDAEIALLEPLGVALHTIDLARIRVGDCVAILGAGCIGLCILQLAKLAGADIVFVTDPLPCRLAMAEHYGGVAINLKDTDPVKAVWEATGHGVDVAIEAAWADQSVQQAAEMTRLGGRLVITGISEADELTFKHSTLRRKGLTIRLVRRMKHVYPRAIRLVESGRVSLREMVSHRFPLALTPEAFELNARYGDEVVKIVIEHEAA